MRKRKNVGLWSDRLKRTYSNSREIAFADEWERAQERTGVPHTGGEILGALIYGHGHGNESACDSQCREQRGRALFPDTYVDRDRIVAATVIQWLGSNVGFSMLESALKRCGYKIVKDDK